MEPENLIAQARAKIIWGEPSQSVRIFLTSNGIADTDADATIKELCAERHAEIRRIGLRRTFFGAAILAASSLLIFLSVLRVDLDKIDYSEMRGRIVVAVAAGFAGLYGAFKIIDGVLYFCRAKSDTGSLSDMRL